MMDSKESVEEIGVIFERFGRPPMESRVFACLLLAEPPYRSFDEIVEFLGASKSAVSNALSNLQKDETVSYRTFSGDRKRYFQVDLEGWRKKIFDSARNLSNFNTVLKRVLKYRQDSQHQDISDEIQKILEFQLYLGKTIEDAIEQWEMK